MKKRIWAVAVTLCLCLAASVEVLALPIVTGGIGLDGTAYQGAISRDVSSNFVITPSPGVAGSTTVYSAAGTQLVRGETYYFRIGTNSGPALNITPYDLNNSGSFYFRTETVEGSRLLNEVRLTNLNGSEPHIAISVKSGVTANTDRLALNVYFQAKNDNSGIWSNGNVFNAYFDLSVDNGVLTSTDNNIDVNTNVTYQPSDSADNTIYWNDNGYDIAALDFTTGSNPRSFNALLSTKINNTVYSKYGDPVNAVLHFRTFSSNAVVSASRAMLSLYNPFDWDVAVRDVRIYTMSGDTLTDVTSQFTYNSGDDVWYIYTRTLGSYVISSKDLLTGTNTTGTVLTPDGTSSLGDTGTVLTPTTPATTTTTTTGGNPVGATVQIVPLQYSSAPVSTAPATGDRTFVTLAVTLGLVSLAAIPVARFAYKKQKASESASQEEV